MKETTNLKLKKPEKNEYINIDDINNNMDVIDEEVAKKASASGGDISDTVITSAEEPKDEYPVPAAGDSAKVFLGKTRKFFADIRNWMTGVCMLGQIVNNCVTDNAKLPLSAAQGKSLMDLYNVLNTKSPIFTTNSGGTGKNVTTTDWVCLGTNINVPAGYVAILNARRGWNVGDPNGVCISTSDTSMLGKTIAIKQLINSTDSYGMDICTIVGAGTYYLWSKAARGISAEEMRAILLKKTTP